MNCIFFWGVCRTMLTEGIISSTESWPGWWLLSVPCVMEIIKKAVYIFLLHVDQSL